MSEASEETTAVEQTPPEPAPEPSPPQARSRLRLFGRRFDDNTLFATLGGFGVFITAVLLYTRFSINGGLGRDESIYAYEAQRFSRGQPLYASIFDPKTPVSGVLGGIAAFVAHQFHANDLHAIRLMFLLVSVLAVVAIYLLCLQLFTSVPGAFAGAMAFTFFTKFAHDALIGPDAKTPGVLFMVLCMLFLARRKWFTGALFAGLAFAVWQPLFPMALIAIVAATAAADAGLRHRVQALLRAVVGAALPMVIFGIYFAIAGAFKVFIQATLLYPLSGSVRAKESWTRHLIHPIRVIDHYPMTATLFWLGTIAIVVLVVLAFVRERRAAFTSPLVLIVFGTFLLNILYALYDFQSDPDTLPLLPYPAIGIGGAIAAGYAYLKSPVLRRAATSVVVAVAVVLAAVSWVNYSDGWGNDNRLIAQTRDACALNRVVGHGTLESLGNPVVFVLTHRKSPTNFIYLSSGVDGWKIRHTKHGFRGWIRQIVRRHPPAINVDGWKTGWTRPTVRALRHHGYKLRFIGPWKMLMTPAEIAHAKQVNVKVNSKYTRVAQTIDGKRLPAKVPCGNG